MNNCASVMYRFVRCLQLHVQEARWSGNVWPETCCGNVWHPAQNV